MAGPSFWDDHQIRRQAQALESSEVDFTGCVERISWSSEIGTMSSTLAPHACFPGSVLQALDVS